LRLLQLLLLLLLLLLLHKLLLAPRRLPSWSGLPMQLRLLLPWQRPLPVRRQQLRRPAIEQHRRHPPV